MHDISESCGSLSSVLHLESTFGGADGQLPETETNKITRLLLVVLMLAMLVLMLVILMMVMLMLVMLMLEKEMMHLQVLDSPSYSPGISRLK